jgi:hypothetical protein
MLLFQVDDSDLLDETTTRMAVNNLKRNVRKEPNEKGKSWVMFNF